MSLATLKPKVEALIKKAQSGGGLPDWDDDSPVVCSGTCYANNNAHWEITEKGTFRVVGSGTGYVCNSDSFGNISLIAPQILPYLNKIKQAYISDGITACELWYMFNCERARFPESLTRKPGLREMTALKEWDMSADIYTTLSEYNCSNMDALEKVTLSPLTTVINGSAFHSCRSLREINLENITEFKSNSFAECFSLSSPIVFNAGLTSIQKIAFYRTGLTSVTFQTPTTGVYPTIANNAFGQCNLLKDIYVPWAEGAVANAPWGATYATIHYNAEV